MPGEIGWIRPCYGFLLCESPAQTAKAEPRGGTLVGIRRRHFKTMNRVSMLIGLALLTVFGQSSFAEACREIHGRAILYSGDAFLEIWHVGTHHTFFVVDEESSELIFRYLHYPKSDNQALFADFTICPTERYKQGASQPAAVKRIRNAHVVARHGK